MLKPITTNEHTIKDLVSFTKEVEKFNPNLVMASFDVKSLLIDIPLAETITLCVKNIYRNQTHLQKLLLVVY